MGKVFKEEETTAKDDAVSLSASFTGSMPAANLQLFVRLISGKTLVLRVNPEDSVESIHERVRAATGIPVAEQRLIQTDDGLQLVGRWKSTAQLDSWRLVGDLLHYIFQLRRGISCSKVIVKNYLNSFLKMTPDEIQGAMRHLDVFLASSAPAALIRLYIEGNQAFSKTIDRSIRHFLVSGSNALPRQLHIHFALIVLQFCKLLRQEEKNFDSPLFVFCMEHFQSFLENMDGMDVGILIPELFGFVGARAEVLIEHFKLATAFPTSYEPLFSSARDVTAFSRPLWTAIVEQNRRDDSKTQLDGENVRLYHGMFIDVLYYINKCLSEMEECLAENGSDEVQFQVNWRQYFVVLKELNSLSKVDRGTEIQFCWFLGFRRVALRALIMKHADRSDVFWLLDHKEATDFECRKHLAMTMFPEIDIQQDFDPQLEIIIDRSKLLEDSYEYIINAAPDDLRSGLYIQFKNEEATGDGVLREWFLLVCQTVFNPQNPRFVACPNDRRRFYPSPESGVDPSNLNYFRFYGRLIALALMHKVQVGIVFDRVFFMQLAGKCISLEDIQEAEPVLYNSWKDILNMDEELIDSDALGLTFVTDVWALGQWREVENITVNSKNRKHYIDLLTQRRFVISISKQISHFAQGFADILCNAKIPQLFFRSLDLQDLDWMLRGSESPISIEDWKAHTVYDGYTETDPQISWFWKIVEEMSEEQKRSLLFFWTSLKYLPIEGFGGLAERLYIGKIDNVSYDRLPSCLTCFFRLNIPTYPSMDVMRERLSIITHEHVSYSFGTV